MKREYYGICMFNPRYKPKLQTQIFVNKKTPVLCVSSRDHSDDLKFEQNIKFEKSVVIKN